MAPGGEVSVPGAAIPGIPYQELGRGFSYVTESPAIITCWWKSCLGSVERAVVWREGPEFFG